MSLASLRLDQSEVAETANAESSGVPNHRVDAVTEAHISLTERLKPRSREVFETAGAVQQPENVEGKQKERRTEELEKTAKYPK